MRISLSLMRGPPSRSGIRLYSTPLPPPPAWTVAPPPGNRAGLQTPTPCVLKIQLLPKRIDVFPRIFMAPEAEWAEFDPDLMIGPMADNDAGMIVRDAVKLGKDAVSSATRSLRDRRGRKLDPLRLGNQVVFANERLEDSLRLVGYYLRSEGRLKYHDNQHVRRA
ncbi:hypothetical protein FE782_02175 [Paenibacillus antri]|uniref:Uncharacterized protein n=1 Tax=Paenibacillus antri TaxID=2582848 RepID=A0A5R9GPF9_9BACL|nr:hypothetical protein [Paenibacillus antri]TLS54175.1 hypothetical protein FE782_02175 [Paenibacillus antri]